jgi:hypothetical protein
MRTHWEHRLERRSVPIDASAHTGSVGISQGVAHAYGTDHSQARSPGLRHALHLVSASHVAVGPPGPKTGPRSCGS